MTSGDQGHLLLHRLRGRLGKQLHAGQFRGQVRRHGLPQRLHRHPRQEHIFQFEATIILVNYVFPERDLSLESFYCLSCLRPPPSGEQTSYLAPPSRKVDRILLPYWKSPVYKKEGRKIESYSSTAVTAVRCSTILHVWWRGNAVSSPTDKTD